MTITCRLWSHEELEASLKDKWLATILMNGTTFNKEEISYYPYKQRRTYMCEWVEDEEWTDGVEPVTIYATDERMLLKFIDAEYTRRPDHIYQVITQYRPIKTS